MADAAAAAPAAAPAGWWGPITANVEWCEENYVWTEYVAELFNTLSSVPLIVIGVWGAVTAWRHTRADFRYLLSHLGIALVGVGSVAFHATLKSWAQYMDEVPMLLVNLVFLYCTIELDDAPRHGAMLPAALVALGTFLTVGYVVYDWYPLFLLGYGGVLVAVVYRTYCHVYAEGGVVLRTKDSRFAALAARLFKLCFSLYFGGLFLWIVDNAACAYVQPLMLHSWWHLGAGFGTYTWVLVITALRAPGLRATASVKAFRDVGSALPYVRLHKAGAD